MNFPKTLPKMSGIGSVHLEFKRCGKPTCRCCRGLLHGPYAYHHWLQRGRQKKAYVTMRLLTKAFEAIERQRARTPKIAEILGLLKRQNYG